MINTPKVKDEELKSRLEGLTDNQKDQLFELLKEDKKLREDKNRWNPEKLINLELKYFEKIINEIRTMKIDVDNNFNNNYWSVIFIEYFRNILNDVESALSYFKYDIDQWNERWMKYNSLMIKADIQNILINNGLNRIGWINNLMRFLSYSRNLIIKNQMKDHWIDVSLLERVCSNITKMLDENNMKVIVPTVLTENFDKNLYDYINGNTWIDKFFPDISLRDYKWKVFDITYPWYEIKDEEGNIVESKKPVVYYK